MIIKIMWVKSSSLIRLYFHIASFLATFFFAKSPFRSSPLSPPATLLRSSPSFFSPSAPLFGSFSGFVGLGSIQYQASSKAFFCRDLIPRIQFHHPPQLTLHILPPHYQTCFPRGPAGGRGVYLYLEWRSQEEKSPRASSHDVWMV